VVDSRVVTENRFNKAFGTPSERAVGKVKNTMSDVVKEFIAQSPFIVIATSNRDGECDASPKGGKPGFVRIVDDRHLVIPDVAGNKLFQSYQNMEGNPQVGVLFLIPGSNDTVRVNGRVTILPKEELDRLKVDLSINNPDDNSIKLQGILVEVDEAYTHCPRAFKFAELWNVESIQRRQEALRRR
jgi:PPOX class probable FMN-dependent enzyme